MYTFSMINQSLFSEEKSNHILEQKYTEYWKMYDLSLLIVYLPQNW